MIAQGGLLSPFQTAQGPKPVMTFTDGESKILAKVRGEKAVVSRLVELCKAERRAGTPYLMILGL